MFERSVVRLLRKENLIMSTTNSLFRTRILLPSTTTPFTYRNVRNHLDAILDIETQILQVIVLRNVLQHIVAANKIERVFGWRIELSIPAQPKSESLCHRSLSEKTTEDSPAASHSKSSPTPYDDPHEYG